MTRNRAPDPKEVRSVYLAGPMTGHDEYNYPAFHRIAKRLRERGYDVFNPAELTEKPGMLTRANYLRVDVSWIAANADGVVAMLGWERSRGARLEVLLGLELGLKVWAVDADGDFLHYIQDVPPMPDVNEPVTAPQTILQEANDLIYGDRQAQYTHPYDNFSRIGAAMGGTLAAAGYVPVGTVIDPAVVGWLLVDLKKGRDLSNPGKRDTLVDAAGYVGTVAMVRERQAQTASEFSHDLS